MDLGAPAIPVVNSTLSNRAESRSDGVFGRHTSRYVHPDSDSIQKCFDRVTEAGYMHRALPEPSENRNDK